ncbi:glycosyltransferase family 9 protein [Spirosoma utsteinense]|uniref:ADP-heptose:LPS heptosyltransferase n=1 Tax=Spirosoma utsteinense TaxID=2585773 RepID=A0ABR6W7K9_9BACT|nr:glycosyltransferase family 9 protein [Spirosoma utsteinense]MBC3783937.1 ADP-heptose:LPS heptosyltransferase [Spirosoma utsteinense]MBC3792571.1 ADP-heptose:LPS heptosyltransferase [Spirosoma utsteinense]
MTQLLLLRFSAMGDVALLAPVVESFVSRYADARLTVVTRPKFAVFFAQFPNVRVVELDVNGRHKGLAGLFRLFQDLRKIGVFDLLIDANENLRSAVLKRLFRMAGILSVTIDKGRADKKALTRKEDKIRRPLPHSIERYATLFGKAGFAVQPASSFSFTPSPAAETELFTFLERRHISLDEPCLGIAPFAQHLQKMWPFERFGPLLEKIYAYSPVRIFLFGGGAQEIARLETLRQRFPQVVIVAGQLSLAAELALIHRLTGMLCMDSGNMHLAALSGIPVLSIWGATHPDAGFRPWGQADDAIIQVPANVLTCRPCSVFGNVPCWRGDLACLNDISVEQVAERVRRLLDAQQPA